MVSCSELDYILGIPEDPLPVFSRKDETQQSFQLEWIRPPKKIQIVSTAQKTFLAKKTNSTQRLPVVLKVVGDVATLDAKKCSVKIEVQTGNTLAPHHDWFRSKNAEFAELFNLLPQDDGSLHFSSNQIIYSDEAIRCCKPIYSSPSKGLYYITLTFKLLHCNQPIAAIAQDILAVSGYDGKRALAATRRTGEKKLKVTPTPPEEHGQPSKVDEPQHMEETPMEQDSNPSEDLSTSTELSTAPQSNVALLSSFGLLQDICQQFKLLEQIEKLAEEKKLQFEAKEVQLEDWNSKLNAREDSLREREKKLNELRELEQNLAAMKEELRQTELDQTNRWTDMQDRSGQLNVREAQQNTREKQLKDQERLLKDSNQQLDELQKQKSDLRKTVQQLQQEEKQLNSKLAMTTGLIKTSEQSLERSRKALGEAEDNLENTRRELEHANRELDSNPRMQHLNTQIEWWKGHYETMRDKKDVEIRRLNEENSENLSKLFDLKRKCRCGKS